MEFDRNNFFVREKELANVFGFSISEFDEIVLELESLSDISIPIRELVHFRFINKTRKIRCFSNEGVLAIAKYLESRGLTTETMLNAVLKLIEQHSLNRFDSNIRRNVYNNSSSLRVSRQRHWLSYTDVFRILKTTRQRLDEAFINVQRSDNPMIFEEDFEDIDTVRYFSFSGLEKLSIELAASLYSKERRKYCERIPWVAPPVLKYLAITPSPSQEDIKSAMNYAKKRDKEKCQVTGARWTKDTPIELVKHHLFDKHTYYYLAADLDNIITISELVSDEFHLWNGGFDKSCTIDDFIEYVELFYSEKNEVILMLHNLGIVLQTKLSLFPRFLPEST